MSAVLEHTLSGRSTGLAFSADGTLFVTSSNTILSTNGKDFSTFATAPSTISGLTIDNFDNLFFSCENSIYRVLKSGDIIKFVGKDQGNKDGIGEAASFHLPIGICFDDKNFLYVCDNQNHSIRKVSPEGNVTTLCGGNRGYKDESGKLAAFYSPYGIAFDRNKNILYVVEFVNNKIRTITTDGVASTLCDTFSPYSITIDETGTLFVGTSYNGIIKVENGKEKLLNVLKDTGIYGLAFNNKGDLFISCSGNKIYVMRELTKFPPKLKPIDHKNPPPSNPQPPHCLQPPSNPQHLQYPPSNPQSPNAVIPNKVEEVKAPSADVVDELTQWLKSVKLEHMETILRDLGARDLEYLKLLDETDLSETKLKPLEKKMLLKQITDLKKSDNGKQNNLFFPRNDVQL